jgi:hypothetical protein
MTPDFTSESKLMTSMTVEFGLKMAAALVVILIISSLIEKIAKKFKKTSEDR